MRNLFTAILLFSALAAVCQNLAPDTTCFQQMRNDGKQAYARAAYDDAAALFRAAKSCDNASQLQRKEMDDRIRECRRAAEAALRASEQRAVREARQSLAANRARQAKELLTKYNRTLAYRLADFANEYIAPADESNPECLQAMYDAWYFVPPGYSNSRVNRNLGVPLCYLIADNLGSYSSIQFGGRGEFEVLCAYAPNDKKLYCWKAGSFEAEKPVDIPGDYTNFYLAPDGKTFLFINESGFAISRSGRLHEITLKKTGAYAFSQNSDAFYYYNSLTQTVEIVDLVELFTPSTKQNRKGMYNVLQRANQYEPFNPSQKSVDIPKTTSLIWPGAPPEAISFFNNQLWLGFTDSLVIFQKEWPNWRRLPAIHLDYKFLQAEEIDRPIVILQPEAQLISLAFSNHTLPYPVADTLSGRWVRPYNDIQAFPLAVQYTGDLTASLLVDENENNVLYIHHLKDSLTENLAFLSKNENVQPLQGAFSSNSHWLAMINTAGQLKVWALRDLHRRQAIHFDTEDASTVLGPAGKVVYTLKEGIVKQYLTDSGKTIQVAASDSITTLRDGVAGWVSYRLGNDTVAAHAIGSNKQVLVQTESVNYYLPASLDYNGRYFVCATDSHTVKIFSLPDGKLLVQRRFSGMVLSLAFRPQSEELLVISQGTQTFGDEQQSTVYLWNFRQGGTIRTLRLHSYSIRQVAFSPDGHYLAISNSNDIRVHAMDNLFDETLRVEGGPEFYVSALAFSPDSRQLAVGSLQGSIICWEVQSSKKLYKLEPGPESQYSLLTFLHFMDNGKRLGVLSLDNYFYAYDLVPDDIRANAQNGNRYLVAFDPEDIRTYELETALAFTGNLARLAGSGDLPLIRSFFNYYNEESHQSNNIERVAYYVNNAVTLYNKLQPESRRALQSTIIEQLEDYHWKLLLRERFETAEEVVRQISSFNDDRSSVLKAQAHRALLSGRLENAAEMYVDWAVALLLKSNYLVLDKELTDLFGKWEELARYGLLSDQMLNCLCVTFGKVPHAKALCAESAVGQNCELDEQRKNYWVMLAGMLNSAYLQSGPAKTRILAPALKAARNAAHSETGRGRLLAQEYLLQLDSSLLLWENFEQGSVLARLLSERSQNILQEPLSNPNLEKRRLLLKSRHYYNLGNFLINTTAYARAETAFQAAISLSEKIKKLTGNEQELRELYTSDLGPLWIQLGLAHLLNGKPAEARAAFNTANDITPDGIDAYYFGLASVLEGDYDGAWSGFQEIYNDINMAQAILNIDALRTAQPATDSIATRIEARLNEELVPALSGADTIAFRYSVKGYYFDMAAKRTLAAGLPVPTVNLGRQALEYLQKLVESADSSVNSTNSYYRLMDGFLSYSFYLVYASAGDTGRIRQAIEIGEHFIQNRDQFSFYGSLDYFYTNLGHAYLLRGWPGDFEKAVQHYRIFLSINSDDDTLWEVLLKDFRDLARAGVQLPNLQQVLNELHPGKKWQAADGPMLGLPQSFR